MSGDLGVGFAAKDVSFLQKLIFELQVVLDDAVVDERHLLEVVVVGVGIQVSGGPVGRPAAMRHRELALGHILGHDSPELAELARPLEDLDVRAVQIGDARTVVAPILQASELVKNDLDRILGSDISGNSAHSPLMVLDSAPPCVGPAGSFLNHAPVYGLARFTSFSIHC